MVVHRILEPHIIGTVQNTVFRRHLCEWVLPQEVATKISYNPRQLPVPIRRPSNEDYLLPLHIRHHLDAQRCLRLAQDFFKLSGDSQCSRSLLLSPTLI